MVPFRSFVKEEMQKPGFAREYSILVFQKYLLSSIRLTRKRLHLSQDKFGHATRMTKCSLRNLERWRKHPYYSFKLLQVIADGLGLNATLEYEMEDKGDMQ